MIEIKKINNIQVKPLKTIFDEKKYKHEKMFNKFYPLIYISSRRGAGKTWLVYSILKYCATNKTEIHYFSTTWNNDNVFLEMEKKFKKHNFKFFVHDSLDLETEEDAQRYGNLLEKLYENSKIYVDEHYEKLKKQKYNFPCFIYIFDDFWLYMKLRIMSILCKQSRHTKIMLIYSSQY